MFQFPACAPTMWVPHVSIRWVAPFGNPRIKGRLHLPEAYRSLPRPSSPHRAQASTVRPCFLFLFFSSEIVISSSIHRCMPAYNYFFISLCELTFLLVVVATLACRTTCHFYIQYVKEHSTKEVSVENNGFEPLTPCLQSRCSSQLS